MTDPEMADAMYIEPITPATVAKIIAAFNLMRFTNDGANRTQYRAFPL